MKKVLLILSIMIVVLALASCGHIHLPGEELAIEQEPTCTKDGLGYIYCLECGEVAKIVVIPATGTHKAEIIPAQEATCTEKGSTEGERCSWCGEILVSPQEIPVVAHTYDDKYDETCNECGHVRDAECAHVETDVIEGKDATCTEIGYTDGAKCKKCGETVTAQEVIPMLDHSYSSVVTAPTCTAQGYTTYTCGCGDSYIDTFVDKTPHSFGEWKVVKEATKTEEGLKERSCSCGEKETKIIPLKVSEGLSFILNSDGKSYAVTGRGTCKDKDIIIPSEYKGLPVTEIDWNSFHGEKSIKNVEIPDSVTTIGTYAFAGCTSLVSIVIPDSVYNLEDCSFQGCTSLESVIIGNSVTSIGSRAFEECTSLDSVTIGNSVTIIESYAFYRCTSLTSIIIPSSVTTIDTYAFASCANLRSINISSSVTSIGDFAFMYCSSLQNINYEGTIKQWCNFAYKTYWYHGIYNYTVYCTDGTITQDGTVTYYNN